MPQTCALIIRGGNSKLRLDHANTLAQNYGVAVNTPDYILIQPENSIGIEEIRQVINKAYLKPYQSPKKIVILQDADKLTPEAQNAFLKTLEEPPENTVILLLTSNSDLLLPTIISRCQVKTLPIAQSSTPEGTDVEKELLDIKNCSIGLKFEKAQKIATDRESALKWTESALRGIKTSINKSLQSPANQTFTVQELSQIAGHVQNAHNHLSANANPRLVIENLLLTIK